MSSNGRSPASTVAIDAHNLGKRYQIGERLRYRTLRESAAHALRAPFRRKGGRPEQEHIWALDGVSFTVHQGDVVGIVGRNGAGKSTLLKLLSRITEPTRGYVDLYGRVGSLLEVGTGFHQELTGRENVYLNGAILGMRRQQINRQFDAIVDFAGVAKFIDTPVKHYSSGMYLRLAFAVAAHLEPDILLVDEVLAVGDAEFQKKCLGKMEDVAQTGRTVLFVSHNMAAVNALCPTTIYLEDGRIRQMGPTAQVVQTYLAASLPQPAAGDRQPANPDAPAYIRGVTLAGQQQDDASRTRLRFTLHCHTRRPLHGFTVEWHLTTLLGEPLGFGSPAHFQQQPLDAPAGNFDIDVTIDEMPLGVGRYYLNFRLGDLRAKRYFDIYDQALPFDVEAYDPHAVGRSFQPRKGFGYFHFPDTFTVRPSVGPERQEPAPVQDHAAR